MTNEERSERAYRAIVAYRHHDTPDESHFTDLLCDLMHYADEQAIDFAKELGRAHSNYQAENGMQDTNAAGMLGALKGLLEWAGQMGGWEAACWDRARAAVDKAEATLEQKPEPTGCQKCGGVVGFDAWVDSNGEVVGGPYDAFHCMHCDSESSTEVFGS